MMPLSDRESQILADIEARLRADDPRFARAVGTTTVTSHARRQIKLAVLGFVLGFCLLMLGLLHLLWGLAGFALMLASAVHGANMFKRLGAEQTSDQSGQLRGGLRSYLNDRRSRDDEERDA